MIRKNVGGHSLGRHVQFCLRLRLVSVGQPVCFRRWWVGAICLRTERWGRDEQQCAANRLGHVFACIIFSRYACFRTSSFVSVALLSLRLHKTPRVFSPQANEVTVCAYRSARGEKGGGADILTDRIWVLRTIRLLC